MKILAIDTSSIYASCALLAEGDIRSEAAVNNGLVHSRSLMPMIERCLQNADTDIGQIDVFACVAGPGSFTGIRIGVCAVKGLAQALKKPCAAVNTLDCLRQNFPFASTVCPIMDARRGQVYCAIYEEKSILLNSSAMAIEDLLALLKGKNTVFLGDGVKVYKDTIFAALKERALFAPPHLNYTRASSAAFLAMQAAEENKLVSAAVLDAIYLRKPQAEREYAAKHSQA